jgi:hypothetical protein
VCGALTGGLVFLQQLTTDHGQLTTDKFCFKEEAMIDEKQMNLRMVTALFALLAMLPLTGCHEQKPYGVEHELYLTAKKRQVWAVAPAINLSGQKEVDPLLQADLLFAQLQQVHGLTVIPVNRVVEVYAGLHIEKIQTPEQAALVCDLLGCDGLIVPTVTAFDPYDPPKLGASIQLFRKPRGYARPDNVDPRDLARQASQTNTDSLPPPGSQFVQAVGLFDAANGSVRERVQAYAAGRNDPAGPMGVREYYISMDRYCGFVYNALINDILRQIREKIA